MAIQVRFHVQRLHYCTNCVSHCISDYLGTNGAAHSIASELKSNSLANNFDPDAWSNGIACGHPDNVSPHAISYRITVVIGAI